MPMRYKISENAANLQARVSTILIFIILFLVGGLTYYGISKARQLVATTSTQQIVDTPKVFAPPAPTPIPKPQPVELVDTTSYATPLPDTYAENPASTKVPTYPVPMPERTPSGRYYLQISAFRSSEKAIQMRDNENDKGVYQCLVGVTESDATPYKVLLGPFISLHKVKQFQHSRRLRGFPKSRQQIDYFLLP